jgi:mannose-6-phosphate isomerase-like protein (cupin superfamily)
MTAITVKQEANVKSQQGENFSAVHAGPMAQLDSFQLEHPRMKRTITGKLFVRDLLKLSGMQFSMNKLPAGRGAPFLHQHKANEEAYIFVKGKGQMQVDGEIIDVEEGSIVRIATPGKRCIRNNSSDDLYFICVQAKEGSLGDDTFGDGIALEDPVNWPA